MNVLFVLTSNDKLGNTGRKTGLWLEEFLTPYYRFVASGYTVRLASPAGGKAPIDPGSVDALSGSALYERYDSDAGLQIALATTEKLAAVDPSSVTGVLYPGGHGPVWDLRDNEHSLKIIETLYSENRPVATICHAGCVLLDARKPDGSPLVQGLQVTAFSDGEEELIDMHKVVPYAVESEMRRLGAFYSRAPDWQGHVVRDGNLFSGQNPASSEGVADAVIEWLQKYPKSTAA